VSTKFDSSGSEDWGSPYMEEERTSISNKEVGELDWFTVTNLPFSYHNNVINNVFHVFSLAAGSSLIFNG
jgi:hypothetical protein